MNLGERMKRYEQESVGQNLVYRCPAIIRCDGRAFHSFTRGCVTPWDDNLLRLMQNTALALCEEISTARFAYGQSDEISILLVDYESLNTEQWFGGKVQKIASVAASVATATFNKLVSDMVAAEPSSLSLKGKLWFSKNGQAQFDARVFSIPKEDVVNYFLWRQQDAVRNSIQMLGHHHFSHKQLMNKNCDQIQEMLFQDHTINWNDCPVHRKRGWTVYKAILDPGWAAQERVFQPKWMVDNKPPIFTQERDYVGQWLETEDESTGEDV